MYFMHQWMDEVNYVTAGKTNILTLIKRKG
ncbi:MAG TPA: hypothetical protein DCZ08_13945 [Anaerolineaceae bacterium]|nr:hypothetical protein [Anaerolineaceae bacterium]